MRSTERWYTLGVKSGFARLRSTAHIPIKVNLGVTPLLNPLLRLGLARATTLSFQGKMSMVSQGRLHGSNFWIRWRCRYPSVLGIQAPAQLSGLGLVAHFLPLFRYRLDWFLRLNAYIYLGNSNCESGRWVPVRMVSVGP
jgi:hypothetical protein